MDLKNWITLTSLSGLLLLLAGCGGEAADALDADLQLFAATVADKPLEQACQELEGICQSTGKGCKAFDLFCKAPAGQPPGGGGQTPPAPKAIPGPQEICDLIQKACDAGLTMACDVHQHKCAGGTPGIPSPPTFDKAACCAAVKVCLDTKDYACPDGLKACGLDQLPLVPANLPANFPVDPFKIWEMVCGQGSTPTPPTPPAPPNPPTFDKAACCAAVKVCLDTKDYACPDGLKACGLDQLPGGLPPLPGNLPADPYELWKMVCGTP